MAKNTRQGRNRTNNGRKTGRNIGQSNMVVSTVGAYVNALLSGNETRLSEMTIHRDNAQSAVGSGKSRIQQLQQSGAMRSLQIQPAKGHKAVVLFQGANGKDVPCIGLFEVVGPNSVQSDWKLYIPG